MDRCKAPVVCALLTALFSSGAAAQSPEPVVGERFDEWAVSAGFVYWAFRCASWSDCPENPYLRRKPANGGTSATLQMVGPSEPDLYMGLAADESGVAYYDQERDRILFHPTEDPTGAPTLVDANTPDPTSYLVVDEGWVYWGAANGIWRAPTAGPDATLLMSSSYPVVDLEIDETGVYWVMGGGDGDVWHMPRCGAWPVCTASELGDVSATSVLRADGRTYFVSSEAGGDDRIKAFLSGGGIATWYQAVSGRRIGDLAFNGEYLFFVESNTIEDVLMRKDPADGIGPAEVLDVRQPGIVVPSDGRIAVDDLYVYYTLKGSELRRLPFDARPLQRDLAVSPWMEITQGLQSFDVDVPLVAEKTTFVRVWGRTASGPSTNGVEAELHILRNGVPVGGSPLSPVDGTGTQYLWPVGESVPDRSDADGYWLFHLPPGWTSSGEVTARAVIDPRQMFDDPDRSNNTTETTVEFIERPPACVAFIPVRTHAPKPSTSDPNTEAMFDLFRSLWPTHRLRVFSQKSSVEEIEACWAGPIPYPCYGPYELPSDTKKVMASIVMRDVFTDDPDSCEDAGARVHYVGMVHPGTSTNGRLGTGNSCLAVSWVKLPPHEAPQQVDFTWPRAGTTLPHEMAHNYNRAHVDCGDPDDPDLSYPYSSCHLSVSALSDPSSHFGFDPARRTPIRPDRTGDLMSYADPRWISDWTFKHLFVATERFSVFNCLWDQVCGCHDGVCIDCPWQRSSSSSAATASLPPAWPNEITSTSDVVLVQGAVDWGAGDGELAGAWVYPASEASRGLVSKWQQRSAPRVEEAPTTRNPVTTIRLLDDLDGVLDERVLSPRGIAEPQDSRPQAVFDASFPTPTGTVSRVQLRIDGVVVDEIVAGPAAPAVTLLEPGGGENVGETLTVSWEASDADDDPLRFVVQYSPDGGASWQALTSDLAADPRSATTSVDLDLTTVPGSDPSSLVRVVASDGFRTTLVTSAPFTVSDRQPTPYISEPVAGRQVSAGDAVWLRGGARDPEDEEIIPAALTWSLDGSTVGVGSEVVLEGLAPGSYSVTLEAADSSAQTASADRQLDIAPLEVPELGGAPKLDGFCDDPAWAGAVRIELAEYSDGTAGTVHLLRSPSALYACFTGLDPGSGPTSFVSVRVDVDHSQDTYAQNDDVAFLVDQAGRPYTRSGNGSGGFGGVGPGGLRARVSANDVVWSAELEIDSAAIGGWNHLIGLAVGHYWIDAQGDDCHWPHAGVWNRPSTWATTTLGSLPTIDALEPSALTAGSSASWITVSGSGFDSDAVVTVDGSSVSTSFVGARELEAYLSSSALATAGSLDIAVVNPATADVPSNTVPLPVRNPQPSITNLAPGSVPAGDPGFILTVNGDAFVPGATVLWEGEPLGTTYHSPGQLSASVPSDEIADGRYVEVSVRNPEPSPAHAEAERFRVVPDLPTADLEPVLACESAPFIEVPIILDRPVVVAAKVLVTTVDSGATGGSDYETVSQWVTIPAGSAAATAEIPLIDDSETEGPESFRVEVVAVEGVLLGTQWWTTVGIRDQDGSGAIPGDVDGTCALDAGDLAELTRVVTDPTYVPLGNPDCTSTGEPWESAEIPCVNDWVFRGL